MAGGEWREGLGRGREGKGGMEKVGEKRQVGGIAPATKPFHIGLCECVCKGYFTCVLSMVVCE